MTIKDTVKSAIVKLQTLCESYETNPFVKLDDLEQTVENLTHEVQSLDLASDQILKRDLNTLQSALAKLTSVLRIQQECLERQVHEINLHQRAMHAYSSVANNNLTSLA